MIANFYNKQINLIIIWIDLILEMLISCLCNSYGLSCRFAYIIDFAAFGGENFPLSVLFIDLN